MYVRGLKFLKILEKSVDIPRPATTFQTACPKAPFLTEVVWKASLGEYLRKSPFWRVLGLAKNIHSSVETTFRMNSHRTSWSSEPYFKIPHGKESLFFRRLRNIRNKMREEKL